MKYSIFINQKAVATHFAEAKLDIIDMAVFDYCRDIITSPNEKLKRILRNDRPYTWINYAHLLSNMPLLGITSSDVVRRRINNLLDAKLLVRHVVYSKAYFTLGEKADLLYFDPETPPDTTPKKPAQTRSEAQEAPADGMGDDECIPDGSIENTAVSEQTTPNSKVGLEPNPEDVPDFSEGVPQPKSGAEPNFKDGHTPTEKMGDYYIKINQSDQNSSIKGEGAAAHADGATPLSPAEILFHSLWEQTHCIGVRKAHKPRIRRVLERYSPSESLIQTAILNNKREDWVCEDIIIECNRDPRYRTTA